jgi:branched-chain amino acid transport system ATP-binding protein
MGNSEPLLRVEQVTKQFGELTELEDYNLDLTEGELMGLIGPNGTGKTTVFNLLSGALHPASGSIHLPGHDITTSRPDTNAALGISRTFQNIRLFKDIKPIQAYGNRRTDRYCIVSHRTGTPVTYRGAVRRMS